MWDSEGVRYDEPNLKMMGIEAVKSSTPAPCRTLIKNALKLMMNGTEEDVLNSLMIVVQSSRHFHQKRLHFLALCRMSRSITTILTSI